MSGSKKWYQSKTIWSGVVAVITATINAILQQFGPNPTLQLILNIITGVAGAFGVYGRVVAKEEIK